MCLTDDLECHSFDYGKQVGGAQSEEDEAPPLEARLGSTADAA